MAAENAAEQISRRIEKERYKVLNTLEGWLEFPIIILGFIWLIILLIELIWGLSPALEAAALVIWVIFIIDFSLRFFLAPKKTRFLKKNWLTAISLLLPALRVFRIFRLIRLLRAARAVRGIRLIRLLGSLNRGMKALKSSLRRKGFVYVLILTFIITFVGAAGMYAFESGNKGFTSYGESLWWTGMIMTTQGSESWPATLEGRILGFFLSIFAFAVFGYVTATLASFFIDRDARNETGEVAGEKSIKELKKEIRLLREELREKGGGKE